MEQVCPIVLPITDARTIEREKEKERGRESEDKGKNKTDKRRAQSPERIFHARRTGR